MGVLLGFSLRSNANALTDLDHSIRIGVPAVGHGAMSDAVALSL